MTSARRPRRILVVGSGGREHALAWRLGRDPDVERIVVAPGNSGMADVAVLAPNAHLDATSIGDLCERERIDLVVMGPEGPLADGLTDGLRARGLSVFGPEAAAAKLEGSKAFCREVAASAGIPMAEGSAHEDPMRALRAARALGGRVVIKVDGLAAGKGVTVCETLDEAEAAIRAAMVERRYGPAGATVVVERALQGPEASLIAICDATSVLMLPAARDHKRIFAGDRGPNTGGMGAYSPLPEFADADLEQIAATIHRPALAELARRGSPFRGALFAGLMLTAAGPFLLEFNVRFGDPEAQVLLPRLTRPLGPLLAAAAEDRLAEAAAEQGIHGSVAPASEEAAVGVVLASRGYPGAPDIGDSISGIHEAQTLGAMVFCAGVRADADGGLVTHGGRVLTVVGKGADRAAAAQTAYAGADCITFAGRQLRRDIGRTGAAERAGALTGAAR